MEEPGAGGDGTQLSDCNTLTFGISPKGVELSLDASPVDCSQFQTGQDCDNIKQFFQDNTGGYKNDFRTGVLTRMTICTTIPSSQLVLKFIVTLKRDGVPREFRVPYGQFADLVEGSSDPVLTARFSYP